MRNERMTVDEFLSSGASDCFLPSILIINRSQIRITQHPIAPTQSASFRFPHRGGTNA